MTHATFDEETGTFILTFQQMVRLCANVWNEGYCTNRDQHAVKLAHLHNPYIQIHGKKEETEAI